MPRTIGISQKAVLAFFYPLVATIGGAAASWITSGEFNTAEIRISLAGLVLSGLSALGAYVGKPGFVAQPPNTIPADQGDAGRP